MAQTDVATYVEKCPEGCISVKGRTETGSPIDAREHLRKSVKDSIDDCPVCGTRTVIEWA